jgi:hypothetical protein
MSAGRDPYGAVLGRTQSAILGRQRGNSTGRTARTFTADCEIGFVDPGSSGTRRLRSVGHVASATFLVRPSSRPEVVSLNIAPCCGFLGGLLIRVNLCLRVTSALAAMGAMIVIGGCASFGQSGKPVGILTVSSTRQPANGRIVFVTLPAASGVLAPGRFSIQEIRPDGQERVTIFPVMDAGSAVRGGPPTASASFSA